MLDIAAVSACADRPHNEDYLKYLKTAGADSYLFALADGLGGHGKGEVASNLCVESCCATFQRNPAASAETFFQNAFETAQANLLGQQERENAQNRMKTTLVLCTVHGTKAAWAHIGDSRLYIFRQNKLLLQTADHSVPQMLVASGEIKPSQIRHHEDRNKLLRAMGIHTETLRYQIDETDFDLQPGDAVLLCSDGFWEWIPEKKMQKYLKKCTTAQQALDAMIAYICKKGKGKNMDNYSAILILNR